MLARFKWHGRGFVVASRQGGMTVVMEGGGRCESGVCFDYRVDGFLDGFCW